MQRASQSISERSNPIIKAFISQVSLLDDIDEVKRRRYLSSGIGSLRSFLFSSDVEAEPVGGATVGLRL